MHNKKKGFLLEKAMVSKAIWHPVYSTKKGNSKSGISELPF